MKRILKPLLLAGAAIAALAIARPAAAQTINVNANVPERCQITASADINFPSTYDGLADLDTSGSVTTRCTRGTTYTISITEGNDPVANTTRRMEGVGALAGQFLEYDIYQDAGYTTRWRETTPYNPGASTSNAAVVHPVRARISTGQDPAVGDYQDVVTVSITL